MHRNCKCGYFFGPQNWQKRKLPDWFNSQFNSEKKDCLKLSTPTASDELMNWFRMLSFLEEQQIFHVFPTFPSTLSCAERKRLKYIVKFCLILPKHSTETFSFKTNWFFLLCISLFWFSMHLSGGETSSQSKCQHEVFF